MARKTSAFSKGSFIAWRSAVIFVSVGTFILGFDDLIAAMDAVCKQTGLAAFAQIGNSSIVPQHMQYDRFMPAVDMQRHLEKASLVVCHGGFGIIGDAMRAQKPIIAVPRRNDVNSTEAPANNQLVVVHRLSDIYGIHVCTELGGLATLICDLLRGSHSNKRYDLSCDVPKLVSSFLTRN